MKNATEPRPEYQNVAFFNLTVPTGFDERNPGGAVLLMASEKFGFSPDDFNPGHGGRFYGASKYGFTFEVQVKWAVAENLSAKSHPSVLSIFP